MHPSFRCERRAGNFGRKSKTREIAPSRLRRVFFGGVKLSRRLPQRAERRSVLSQLSEEQRFGDDDTYFDDDDDGAGG